MNICQVKKEECVVRMQGLVCERGRPEQAYWGIERGNTYIADVPAAISQTPNTLQDIAREHLGGLRLLIAREHLGGLRLLIAREH